MRCPEIFIIFLSTKWWVVANIMGLNQLFCFSFFTLCLCLKLCKLNVLTVTIIEIELFLCLSQRHMESGGIVAQNLTPFLVWGEWSASFSYTFSPGKGPLFRGVFRPRQTRQLPRAVDLKGRLLSCQSYYHPLPLTHRAIFNECRREF